MTQTAERPTRPMHRQGIFTAQRSIELTDDMQWYFDQIRQYPLLSTQEEIAVCQRIEQGDESARVELINCNLRLVLSIARYYHRPTMSLHDLIQEGNMGLMHATTKFDWRKGYKFSTYATSWVRQFIIRATPDLEHMIRLPVHVAEKRNLLMKYRSQYISQIGEEPTLEELAEGTGIAYEYVFTIHNHANPIRSFDAPIEDYEDVTLGDMIADPDSTAEYDVERDEVSERISHALECLTEREQFIIKLRFGIGTANRSHVLQEIAKELGLTRERIRQIEEKAMRKLRKALEK